ncbi:hypothetical protein ACO2KH_18280 [Leptospira terpstrae]|uniref:hypothetical protein n=1 Tax=Leptospira terpstrae TaxID=293075 RepID=UPI003D0268CC
MFVTFLDLLGFSQYVKTDHSAANQLLVNYLEIFSFRKDNFFESQTGLEKNKIDSFEDFIPFSDSIFLTSNNINKFIPQLSQFLLDSFIYRGRDMRSPTDPGNPHIIETMDFELKKRKIKPKMVKENCFPVLFRGGISSGEINSASIPALHKSALIKLPIITGEAVVNAVELEKNGQKGPRILISKNTYSEITSDSIKLLSKPFDIENINFELYWPSIIFYRSTAPEIDLKNEFAELFEISINLWSAYKKFPKLENHYFNFMKLVFKSGELAFKNNSWDLALFYEQVKSSLKTSSVDQNYSFLL